MSISAQLLFARSPRANAPRGLTALVSLGGPAVAGAILSLPFGLPRVGAGAALLPAILVGTLAVMSPALFISTALFGVAPDLATALTAAARALRAAGLALLAFAAPAAFLLTTARGDLGTRLLTLAVVGGASLIGLRALNATLLPTPEARRRGGPLFVVWSLVCLAIGLRLLVNSFLGAHA